MQKTLIALAVGATLASGGSFAATIEDRLAAVEQRRGYCEQRTRDLENQVREKQQVINEKCRQIQELVSNPRIRGRAEGDRSGSVQNIEIGGLVEVEAGYNGDSSSDVMVATAEMIIAARVNDWVAAEITFLYEEDETPVEVDVAAIAIAGPNSSWFIGVGQQYVPFGTFETHLVSDPLTLNIGETHETAFLGALESNGFAGGIYIFNGDQDEDGDVAIDSLGGFIGYARENETSAFMVNAGYISDIGDSDGLQDAITAAADYEQVPGFTVDGMVSTGPFTFIAEYTTATDDFRNSELAFGGNGARPSAFNVEAGYSFKLSGKDATIALAYQGTEEALALNLPEKRVAAAISVDVMGNTTMSFEWAHDDDYNTSAGGTGESGDAVTGQLAVAF